MQASTIQINWDLLDNWYCPCHCCWRAISQGPHAQ